MLTWAIVWYCTKNDVHNPLWLVIAMGCDVGIAYYIASGIAGRAL